MPIGMGYNAPYPKEDNMKPTDDEIATARRLADALLAFMAAVEIGRAQRHASRTPARSEQSDVALAAQSPGMTKRGQTNAGQRILLTAREAAEALSISSRSLWQMTAPRGPIPVIRIGSSVRYAIEDLAEAVAALRITNDKSNVQGDRHARSHSTTNR